MFGVISYVGICMVASGVLSALYVITRPIHIRDEMRSWRLWAGLSVVLMILPYAASKSKPIPSAKKWRTPQKR